MGTYRTDIDGLRAVAVWAVIIGHTNSAVLPSGYLGVDMFFVISGYVIAASMTRLQSKSFSQFLLEFYSRRVKRLLPALVFFACVTAVLIALFDELPRTSLSTGAASLLGVSNIYLGLQGTNYFGLSADMNAFLHTWSLGVEEQFYLLFPLLFWFFGCRSDSSSGFETLFRVLLLLSLLSWASFSIFYHSYHSIVYFLMPSRFWELSAGVLAFLWASKDPGRKTGFANLHPGLPAAVLIGLLFSPEAFAVQNTWAIVAATVALLLSVRRDTLVYSVLTWRPLVFFGLISYSLYLWHWGVLVLARLTIGVSATTIPLLFVLMVLLASFSYYVVERPLRYRSWSSSKARDVLIGLGVAVFATVSLMGLNAVHTQTSLARVLGYDISHIQTTWWADRSTGEYLETCHVEGAFEPHLLDLCLGRTNEGVQNFLIGDSHARNYLGTVQSAFEEVPVSYLTMGNHCAFLPENEAARLSDLNCLAYVRGVTEHLTKTLLPGDTVFIGQRLFERPSRWSSEYFEFLSAWSAENSAIGVKVVLLDGTYPLPVEPRACLGLPWRPEDEGCSIPKSAVSSAYLEFDERAKELTENQPDFFYASLRTGLCEGEICGSRTENGTYIWHDRGHITEKAARELADGLREQLAELGYFD